MSNATNAADLTRIADEARAHSMALYTPWNEATKAYNNPLDPRPIADRIAIMNAALEVWNVARDARSVAEYNETAIARGWPLR